jgi:phage host-nuclease inhibitor protein Gam
MFKIKRDGTRQKGCVECNAKDVIYRRSRELVYSCQQCEYVSKRLADLKRHVKDVHDKIRDLKCHICDYKSSQSSNLKQHIKTVHSKIKDLECHICDYKTADSSNLRTHIKTCTGGRVGSAGECQIENRLREMRVDEFTMRTSHELKNGAGNWLEWDCIVKHGGKTLFLEFDGRQHFEPVKFGGMSDEQAIEALEKTKAHDELKNQYCRDNGYPLLRIPYTEFANIGLRVVEFMCRNTNWGIEYWAR